MSASNSSRPPLTDSPWFWVLLFAVAGLIALLAIAPRYSPRQRRIEMQYMAREEMLRRRAEGEPVARETGLEGDAAPPAADELIIPLWPLGMALLLVIAVSSAMLWRVQQVNISRHDSSHQNNGTANGEPR